MVDVTQFLPGTTYVVNSSTEFLFLWDEPDVWLGKHVRPGDIIVIVDDDVRETDKWLRVMTSRELGYVLIEQLLRSARKIDHAS